MHVLHIYYTDIDIDILILIGYLTTDITIGFIQNGGRPKIVLILAW